MTRSHLALFAITAALLASAPAEAGRPRGMQVLDRDPLILPYIEQDAVYEQYQLTYMRGSDGRALLLDQSDASPLRVTPLGFTPPIGANAGSYTVTPDGSVWGAFSSTHGIRVYDLGDLAQPGPLAPVLLQAEALPAGIDPSATQMGIIAILIGLLVEPTPSLRITDGTSNTILFGWTGTSFEPVLEIADGVWTWERPQ